jgi:hypothetical protein
VKPAGGRAGAEARPRWPHQRSMFLSPSRAGLPLVCYASGIVDRASFGFCLLDPLQAKRVTAATRKYAHRVEITTMCSLPVCKQVYLFG